jgi:SAM-dependent methyltransferase
MSLIERIHAEYVHNRRVRVLRDHLVVLIPQDARALDVGCGDGLLDHLILQERPDIELRGIDTLVREQTHIPVDAFDGLVIPHANASCDVVMFVDVLHHTEEPLVLLREAVRVARKAIVIKDHTRNGFLAASTLHFLDWVGNARHGVTLPYQCLEEKFGALSSTSKLVFRPVAAFYGAPRFELVGVAAYIRKCSA